MAAVTLGRFAFGWSGGPSRRWSGRSVLVFLAPGRFAAKTPDHEGWISLDSLVRIETYQWVTRHKAEKLFSRASCLAFERRWDGSPRSWHVEGQDCAWGELNRGSDFPQEIVVRVGRFGPSQSKSRLVLCKTEVLLAAGRRFADHHPALAQILEMGKGRKASGTRQGWI